MSATNFRTYLDLRQAVANDIGSNTSDSAVNGIINQYLNSRYLQFAYMRDWPWRIDPKTLRIRAKITTGTVSVTNGQKLATVSTAIVDDTWIGRWFQVDGDPERYLIVGQGDTATTQINLEAIYVGTTNATATYKVYQNEYGLWPNTHDVVHIEHMANYGPITPKSYQEMLDLIARNSSSVGHPKHYTLLSDKGFEYQPIGANFILGNDFIGDGTLETPKIMFWPIVPQEETVVRIHRTIHIEPMAADADEPKMPYGERWLLVSGATADYKRFRKGAPDEYLEERINKHIAKMLALQDRTDQKPRLVVNNRRRRGLGIFFKPVAKTDFDRA